MRNLKRVLSLTLASVMLMGMMVVGSAAKGYDDVSETDNVEAIEVLQAIEVMVGDERGFGPERPVNRAEMAVVMGKLLSLDYNYYTALCPFTDVYDWAQGWVGACYANKIVSGRGDGIYDPGATVTAVEAASMLMRALGYFQYQNDYADGFELATVTQGKKIGIFDNVGSSATEPMTRNQVAQMVLNALRSAVVEPDGNTINLTTPDGTVLTGKVNYVSVTSNKPYASAISRIQATSIGSTNDGWIVELGEQLYDGDLRLTEYDTDAFQRPARTWEFDGKEIGSYVKKELLRETYTTKVTGRMLYDLLTKNTIETYQFVISIDGETKQTYLDTHGYYTKDNLIRSNTEAVADTDKGVLTEVYVDTKAEIVYISTINTYLAKANADYNEKKDEVTFEVWSLFNEGTTTDKHLVKSVPATDGTKVAMPLTVKDEDFNVADVKEGDIVLVNVAEGEVKKIFDPEIIDDTTITSFKKGSWVNAGGTQYDYSDTAQYDEEVLDDYDQVNMKDTNYRVFLDKYGYMIGLEIIEAPSQYAFLAGIDGRSSNIDNKTAQGNLIFTDGTIKTVSINMEKSKAQVLSPSAATPDKAFTPAALWNTWCTYSVDNDGVYTLTEVAYNDAQFNTNDNGVAYTGNKTDKVGQGRNAEATNDKGPNLTADGKNLLGTIDKKQISLNSNITSYKKIYGNDDTVYLIAGTKKITDASKVTVNTAGEQAVIINDVDSTVTGVQNASLDVFGVSKAAALNNGKNTISYTYDSSPVTNDYENTSHGVYTLFSDKGYVIAAVVVGEDNGVSSTYAYVTSGVTQEDWRSSTNDWKWYRDVIIDGEEVTLEEIGDNMSELKKMAQNNWYEVKFKADGTVKSVAIISTDDVHSDVNGTASNADEFIFCTNTAHFGGNTDGTGNDYPKFVGKIEMVENAQVDNSGKIVLFEDMTANTVYKLDSTSNSFQVQNAVTGQVSKGFSVSPSAKIVLVQDKQVISNSGTEISYSRMNVITTNYAAGGTGLAQALKYLNAHEKTGAQKDIFTGYVSAVFENGFATSVVIYETDPNKVNWGGSTAGGGSGEVTWRDTSDIHSPVYTGKTPDESDIYKLLLSKGYTDISENGGTWSWTESNGFRRTGQAISPVGERKITINGKEHWMEDSDTFTLNDTDILGEAYNKAKHGTYVLATHTDGTDPEYVDITDTITVSEDVSYEVGYYEIDVTQPVTNGATTNASGVTLQAAIKDPNGYYTKKGAGIVSIPVAITTADATTTGAVKFNTDKSEANVDGNIAGSSAPGTYDVTMKVNTANLADDLTVTLSAADQAETFTIRVNGVKRDVDASMKLKDVIDGFPEGGNSYVLYEDLGIDDTASTTLTAATADGVRDGNTAFISADKNRNFGTVEYVGYTEATHVDGGANVTIVTSVTSGDLGTVGGNKYISVGAAVKVTVTGKTGGVKTGDWSGTVTRQMVIESDGTSGTADAVTVDDTNVAAVWGAAANGKVTSAVSDAAGVVTLLSENGTITITQDASRKPASSTAYTSPKITITPAVGT